MGLQFNAIDQCVCFCTNNMQFLSLMLKLQVQLEVGDADSSGSLFIKDCFGYPGFFVFPYEVENCSFKFYKILFWNFDWDCIQLVDCFW